MRPETMLEMRHEIMRDKMRDKMRDTGPQST